MGRINEGKTIKVIWEDAFWEETQKRMTVIEKGEDRRRGRVW